jgi:carbonic anhydrase/acetyltransferase-like protein (isoleucine patch superfamily)
VNRTFQEASPRIHPTAFVHDSSEIIGRVQIRKHASVWPLVVLRGDIESITIGEQSNVQDSTVMHTTRGIPVVLGKGVTVGHGAIIHGARIGDYCLIGMGAILLDGCVIGKECLIGAGALISEDMRIPPRSLVVGLPARVKRPLRRDELALLHKRPKDYVRYADQHRKGSRPIFHGD